MKTVNCWNDLEPYGIVLLTGEACGLCYRLLCDLTEQGRKILGKCLGIPNHQPCRELEPGQSRGSARGEHHAHA